jgi:hypothetical protein
MVDADFATGAKVGNGVDVTTTVVPNFEANCKTITVMA